MDYTLNISVILAIILFMMLVLYREYEKKETNSSDLIRIALTAMALPNLIICLFYLVTDPAKAMVMVEAPQYLTIAVLIIVYLSIKEIMQTFRREEDSS